MTLPSPLSQVGTWTRYYHAVTSTGYIMPVAVVYSFPHTVSRAAALERAEAMFRADPSLPMSDRQACRLVQAKAVFYPDIGLAEHDAVEEDDTPTPLPPPSRSESPVKQEVEDKLAFLFVAALVAAFLFVALMAV